MISPVANPPADLSASIAELRERVSLALKQKLTGIAKFTCKQG
jgi:hypothetical protein